MGLGGRLACFGLQWENGSACSRHSGVNLDILPLTDLSWTPPPTPTKSPRPVARMPSVRGRMAKGWSQREVVQWLVLGTRHHSNPGTEAWRRQISSTGTLLHYKDQTPPLKTRKLVKQKSFLYEGQWDKESIEYPPVFDTPPPSPPKTRNLIKTLPNYYNPEAVVARTSKTLQHKTSESYQNELRVLNENRKSDISFSSMAVETETQTGPILLSQSISSDSDATNSELSHSSSGDIKQSCSSLAMEALLPNDREESPSVSNLSQDSLSRTNSSVAAEVCTLDPSAPHTSVSSNETPTLDTPILSANEEFSYASTAHANMPDVCTSKQNSKTLPSMSRKQENDAIAEADEAEFNFSLPSLTASDSVDGESLHSTLSNKMPNKRVKLGDTKKRASFLSFFSKKPKKREESKKLKKAEKVDLRPKKHDGERGGVASKLFRRLSSTRSSSSSSVNSA